jgi:hypothetical protein
VIARAFLGKTPARSNCRLWLLRPDAWAKCICSHVKRDRRNHVTVVFFDMVMIPRNTTKACEHELRK